MNRFSLTIDQFGSFTATSTRRAEHAACDDSLELQRLQHAATGDSLALSQLYDRHAPALYRVLTTILSSHEDAEDALQETFLKLLDGKMHGAQNVRAYLFASARHIALDVLRRRKREKTHAVEIDETTQKSSDDLWHLLQALPLEQREVVALKVFEEMTFAEIARVVKTSPNTVASRYRYGIEKLRQMLREEENDA